MSDTNTHTTAFFARSYVAKLVFLFSLIVLSIGTMLYAGKSAIGNLYVLSLKSEIQGMESLVAESVAPSVIDARQLAEGVLVWDGSTPSTQAYVASFSRWFDHLISQSQLASDGDSLQLNVVALLDSAIQRRPTMADQYVYKAMELWQQGASQTVIAQQFELAQKYGPFEKSVALASLEFYLAYWPSLATNEKVLASRYLLSPKKYRLNYRQIGKVISRSTNKQRACNLLKFNNVKIRECRA
ncbi:hypothetical protein L4C33_20535 [Vibrio makurazakiensis]|uniref:hypothetical protein n=1 Tax=Vibrio makurazakiensis TaxID=2910250 RepID=UPI003D13D9E2